MLHTGHNGMDIKLQNAEQKSYYSLLFRSSQSEILFPFSFLLSVLPPSLSRLLHPPFLLPFFFSLSFFDINLMKLF